MLSLKNVSGDPVKLRGDTHQGEHTNKEYAEYIINKSTPISDVDQNHVLYERLKPPDDFTDPKSDLIVASIVSVKLQVDLTDSQEKSMNIGRKALVTLKHGVAHRCTCWYNLVLLYLGKVKIFFRCITYLL